MRLSEGRIFLDVVQSQFRGKLTMHVPNANIRSSGYYIAETQARCAKCGRQTRVLALAVPPNHEILVDGEWQSVDGNAFLFYVAALPDAVSRHLHERSPAFRPQLGRDLSPDLW